MAGHRRSWAAVTAMAAGAVLVLTGCGEGDGPARDAASAVESAASRAGDAVSSATAEAGRRFDDIAGGVDVKRDVTLGRPTTDRDGRTTVEVTVRNTADSAKTFAVQVIFNDGKGDLLDTVVTTVRDVPAGAERSATARSNRDLGGDVKAELGRAVRY
ncbi:FxLYD domain-containing protein [Streptomyces sp. NPDC052676]|uniref:FxLYD domain-containing protein n=1 Tax=Streptomyces sp. NPDC052676 TaxID=3154953 RepID=UPI003429F9F6